MNNPEAISSNFSLNNFFEARRLTIQAVETIAEKVEVGMNEQDGFDLIDTILDELGAEKKWHPHKFRIGYNTTKAFKEISDTSIKIQSNDIFFIDIGPVFAGYEGDFGKTFTIGTNEQFKKITNEVKYLFDDAKTYWMEENPSGKDLYSYLKQKTNNLGYVLNTAMNGHRLSDFPHAVYHRGKLQDFEKTPIENLWVLEVLIQDSSQNFGAFYEDIIKKPT